MQIGGSVRDWFPGFVRRVTSDENAGNCSLRLAKIVQKETGETIEKWRKIVTDICEGKEPEPFTLPMPGGAKPPIPGQPPGEQPAGGGGFVKV